MSNLKKLEVFIKEKDTDKEKLDFYSRKMNTKDVIVMKFSSADTAGNLFLYEGNIKIQLDNTEIYGKVYDQRYRSNALRKSYPVVVTSVDQEKKEVHVSHSAAKETAKEEVIAEIDKSLENDEPITISAKVVGIKGEPGRNHAIIDIGNVGITGIIRMRDWSTVFTSDLRLVTKPGDIVKVVIKRKIRWNGTPAYSCSRAEALGFDPWKGIEQKLPKNSVVNVTCISKRPKNFFGKIEGIDEINAYCEYPEPEKKIEIVDGQSYQGYVAAVKENTKLLRVRIFNKIN